MAEEKKSRDFISKIVRDPKNPPKTTLLSGFLGASSEEGHTRLYLDPELSDYVEIPDGAILHVAESKDDSPVGETLVWIQREAQLIHGEAGGSRFKASFLEGRISQDYLAAAQAGIAESAGSAFSPPTQSPIGCPNTIGPWCLTISPWCPTSGPGYCPTRIPVLCPTRQIWNCPTRIPALCPTRQNWCPSRQILHCPSHFVLCRSVLVICQTQSWQCQHTTALVRCQTVAHNCPSFSAGCQSVIINCPTRTPGNCPTLSNGCPQPSAAFQCPTLGACPSAVDGCPSAPGGCGDPTIDPTITIQPTFQQGFEAGLKAAQQGFGG